jgi:hypothetical protein
MPYAMGARLKKQKQFFQHPDLYMRQGAQIGVYYERINP